MTIARDAVAAVLRLAAPDAPAFTLDAAVDAALDTLCVGMTTADRLPTPAPASAPPSPPEPAQGQVRVEVTAADEREWPDSGNVLTLTLRVIDDATTEPIRCRFDQTREVPRRIALAALGGLDGEDVSALVGRQAVVETRAYTTRDGVERVGVARWIVPRKPRKAAQRTPAVRNRKPEASSLPGDDIPF